MSKKRGNRSVSKHQQRSTGTALVPVETVQSDAAIDLSSLPPEDDEMPSEDYYTPPKRGRRATAPLLVLLILMGIIVGIYFILNGGVKRDRSPLVRNMTHTAQDLGHTNGQPIDLSAIYENRAQSVCTDKPVLLIEAPIPNPKYPNTRGQVIGEGEAAKLYPGKSYKLEVEGVIAQHMLVDGEDEYWQVDPDGTIISSPNRDFPQNTGWLVDSDAVSPPAPQLPYGAIILLLEWVEGTGDRETLRSKVLLIGKRSIFRVEKTVHATLLRNVSNEDFFFRWQGQPFQIKFSRCDL